MMFQRLRAWLRSIRAISDGTGNKPPTSERENASGSIEDFATRDPASVPGAYYVDEQCLDCSCCQVIAPTIFARNNEYGCSFVQKQPSSPEEFEAAEEALATCPHEAIRRNGSDFDWHAIPANPYRLRSENSRKERECGCKVQKCEPE
jgi:ferredoxin